MKIRVIRVLLTEEYKEIKNKINALFCSVDPRIELDTESLRYTNDIISGMRCFEVPFSVIKKINERLTGESFLVYIDDMYNCSKKLGLTIKII